MRRLAVFVCALLVLSACGKKAKVSAVPPPIPGPVSTPGSVPASELEGLASYYAAPYHGRPTASGEIFDTYKAMTAAHRTLPFNTVVRVTNKTNGQSVEVRINDRGPFVKNRVIDLSLAAAQKIDMVRAGVVPVKLHVMKVGEAAATGAPNSSAGLGYAVQVGAFSNPDSAEDLKKQLSKKYPDVSIQKATVNDTTIYRVRIGNEPDLQSAEKLASRLRKHDLNPFVVRVN